MKIVTTYGCISNSVTFDGVSSLDLTKERETEILRYLLDKLGERVSRGELGITDIVNIFPCESCETSDHSCETCGDSVTTTIWEI